MTRGPQVAWVTCVEASGQDPDEPLGLVALREQALHPELVVWDDDTVDWERFDLVLPRSTWDYTDKLEDFLSWAQRVGALGTLANPYDALIWSLDKVYLTEMERAGVPVVPTTFVAPGAEVELPNAQLVIKPSVGAGSRGVGVFTPEERAAARQHVSDLGAAGLTAMVQPALASVPIDGEWPMIFFDGQFSHSASKRVVLPERGRLTELFAHEITAPHQAEPAQIAVADQAVRFVRDRFGPQTYARVDLVRDDRGDYLVLEVELVEPSLFLLEGSPTAAQRLARAVAARQGADGVPV